MKGGDSLAGRYTLLEALGPGGTTAAWLAHDTESGRLVVLRVLADELVTRWEVLRDACQQTRGLAHAHIAQVFDFHREGGICFLSREYVEGVGIATLAGRPREEVLTAMASVAAALEAAHAAGVVHGDLKASKVLRDFAGAVRVVDLGLGAALRAASASGGASDDAELSSPARRGEDIHALGCLLHETLGRARGRDPVPAALTELVDAMRSADPGARPVDLAPIRRVLENLVRLAGPPPVRSTPPPALAAAPPVRSSSAPASPSAASDAVVPRVRLPSRHRGASPSGESRNAWYVGALAGLAVLALLVVFVLPRWIEGPGEDSSGEPSAEAAAASSTGPATPEADASSAGAFAATEPGSTGASAAAAGESAPAGSSGSAEDAEREAQDLLARLVPLREQLESQAVERWAAEEFAASVALEKEGDAALVDERHTEARDRYAEALAGLEAIDARREDVLRETLAQGRAALEKADGSGARGHFELALAIDAGNAEASRGLARVDTLDEVLWLVRDARRAEADGRTEDAVASFSRAVEIDPEWRPAQEGLDRTRARLAAESYDRALSAALVALAGRDFATARKRFQEARALRPDSPEVAAGLRQLEQAETSGAIASRRARAEAAEASERWSEAAEHYRAILAIEGQLAFAREGLARNEELARMASRIDGFLADPRRLFSATALNEARLLVESADRASGGRPALAERARKLRLVIRVATTPIPVEFRSDSATQVVIRRVGELGSFERRDVPLKPGDYVVVGQRDGYRDVRREISVVPGASPPVVDVRCTERI